MLERFVPIQKAADVKKQVKLNHEIEVGTNDIRKILKQELGLKYRVAKTVPIQSNDARCLVLRQ